MKDEIIEENFITRETIPSNLEPEKLEFEIQQGECKPERQVITYSIKQKNVKKYVDERA